MILVSTKNYLHIPGKSKVKNYSINNEKVSQRCFLHSKSNNNSGYNLGVELQNQPKHGALHIGSIDTSA